MRVLKEFKDIFNSLSIRKQYKTVMLPLKLCNDNQKNEIKGGLQCNIKSLFIFIEITISMNMKGHHTSPIVSYLFQGNSNKGEDQRSFRLEVVCITCWKNSGQ